MHKEIHFLIRTWKRMLKMRLTEIFQQTRDRYRAIQVKVDETKQLFQILENMDRFLIKWYFDYFKGGEFYMVQKKNLAMHSKSLSNS